MKINHEKRGFTLIEMLIVIAILAILFAILIPVGSKVRKLSENATCVANIRTIATAMMAYYADHDEFPSSQQWVSKQYGRNGPNGVWAEWAVDGNVETGTLWEYVGSKKAYLCPTFERVFDRSPAHADLTAYVSYSMNEYFNPPGKNDSGIFTSGSWMHSSLNLFHGQRGEVRYPSQLAIVGEENTWKTPYGNHALNNLALGVGPVNGGIIDSIASFHNPTDRDMQHGYSNVAFFDLHVASHHIADSKKLFTPYVLKEHFNWFP